MPLTKRIHTILRLELRPMFSIAWPVILAEIGWIMMGVVDTIMVGRVSPEAIGAVGLGSTVFAFFILFGMGVLLGLDFLVSYAYGAGNLRDCKENFIQGLYIAAGLGLGVFLLFRLFIHILPAIGIQPEVERLTIDYLYPKSWAILPLMLFFALRRYLQALHIVKPVTVVLLTANGINIFINWLLIFGKLGAPELGSTGAAYGTLFSMIYMFLFLSVVVVRVDRRLFRDLEQVSLRLNMPRVVKIFRLGLPAAFQILLEVGAFAVVTLLAGKLSALALAAHQISLRLASFTFMVPLGMSSAAAVRVGQALGKKDNPGAIRSGWTALFLSSAFMTFSGIVFVVFPNFLLFLFTDDAMVITIGVRLLLIAALFQLFDGLQITATGILRGLGNTRTPMLLNIVGHWVFGIPTAVVLCFVYDLGVFGLWIGLCVGLIIVAMPLLFVWFKNVRRLKREATEDFVSSPVRSEG